MPEATPRRERGAPSGERGAGGRGGVGFPFEQNGYSPGQARVYQERDPWIAQQEERERTSSARVGANPMSMAQGASAHKPLRIYPFGVSRNRLEQAIKNLRVPATLVREMDDSDLVLTLKNYYRKSPQALRAAESVGVPVFVLKSNTQMQIESALANVFNVEPQGDPLTSAMVEAEDAIATVLETARPVDLAPQSSQIRKLQHQIAERYNLASVSRGREPFRRVRIFRQD
jgi:R3H domain